MNVNGTFLILGVFNEKEREKKQERLESRIGKIEV